VFFLLLVEFIERSNFF